MILQRNRYIHTCYVYTNAHKHGIRKSDLESVISIKTVITEVFSWFLNEQVIL